MTGMSQNVTVYIHTQPYLCHKYLIVTNLQILVEVLIYTGLCKYAKAVTVVHD